MTRDQTTEVFGTNHQGNPVSVTLPTIDGISFARDRSETDPKTLPVRFGRRNNNTRAADEGKCSIAEAIAAIREVKADV